MNRRTFLGTMAAASVPVSAVATPAFDLQKWLDTTDPVWVAEYHAARLAEVMNRLDPTRAFRSKIDRQAGFALIVGSTIS